jgi:hypothetical protein
MHAHARNDLPELPVEVQRCQSELATMGWSAWDTTTRDGRSVSWLVAVRRDERRMVAQDPDRQIAWERMLQMVKRIDKATPATQ